MDKTFSLLEDPDFHSHARQGIQSALPSYSSTLLPDKTRKRLRRYAVPLVRKALASEKVTFHGKTTLRGVFRSLLR